MDERLIHVLLLIAWAVCSCLGFIGYGKALLSVCRLHNPSWALAGCIGISVLIGAGGFLEITGCIRRPILFGIVLIGDALLAVAMWRDYHRIQDWVSNVWRLVRMNSAVALLLFLLIALSATRIAGNLEGRYFNRYDDLGGYLSFPAEMLQLGSLPSDPFSARRIESSLGGSYFLQTFMMLAGDARTIRFIDWGFGSVLFLAIVFAICRKLKLSIIATLALSLLTFVIPFRRLNTTMVVLPAALFGVLFLLELAPELDELHLWLRPALMGITASAISTLKSTYIAPAVLVCALYYLAEIATATKHRGSVFLQGAICALTAGFCLSPWMVGQKHKEGTYLFPILGRGYHASGYGNISLPGSFYLSPELWAAILSLASLFLIAITCVFIARRCSAQTRWLEPTTFFLAILFGVCALGLANGGESILRYSLPFVAPGAIIFISYIIIWYDIFKTRTLWLNAAAAFCALWLAGIIIRYGIQEHVYREYMTDIGFSSPWSELVSFDANEEKRRLAALQASVPPGQPILAHLFVSYLLDFKRNPILISDWPGMAGPFPGMPIGKGPEVLRQYLLEHSIRFLAFSYGRGRWHDSAPQFTLQQLVSDPKIGGRHVWSYIISKISIDAKTNFDLLKSEYIRVYDDGDTCVLDIQKRSN